MYTVYDRIFGDFPAKNTGYTDIHRIFLVLSNPTYETNGREGPLNRAVFKR